MCTERLWRVRRGFTNKADTDEPLAFGFAHATGVERMYPDSCDNPRPLGGRGAYVELVRTEEIVFSYKALILTVRCSCK